MINKIQEYSTNIPNALIEVSYRAYDSICNVILVEIREILKQGLFRSVWDNDVRCITSLQTLLEKYQKGQL
jgi:hypothetical protein